MNAKVIFALGCFISVLQISYQKPDQRLKQCSQKLLQQINALNWKQPPKCLNQDKLKALFQSVDTFKGFFDGLPRKCRTTKVKKQDAAYCVQAATGQLKSKGNDLKAAVMSAIHSLYAASSGCIKEAASAFNNLDKYVLKGCQ
ncbi:unnamed protein product [Acanthoscelides obtectus]|uniref:Uncharacterized protein n=1 Tax=Acanthoscelides obtectus TaxID=200917 RepID=A0A9P0LT36_ACAOB|nr:unnamed protein product [Acanthoscelides obtectus]CAK1621461.1 hypothetical protein AOBTE_LOCUS972 [Acanthoscelides obtectus]